ncbi:MAG: response regulator [Micavibrio sp.]|nr:response regulator [Micavibrio sp.]
MINVLLVEDDDADILILQEAMNITEFQNRLFIARDGLEALELLQDETYPNPDFILLDLNMPKMDGHQVLKWIKNHPELRRIPVGILTTSSAERDIEKAYKNYASYYITKPSSFQELKLVVQAINDFWTKIVCLPKRYNYGKENN